jgi:hypothetical protein
MTRSWLGALAALTVATSSAVALAQKQSKPASDADPAPTTPAQQDPADPAAEPAAPAVADEGGQYSIGVLSGRLETLAGRSEQLRAKVNMLKDAMLTGGPSGTARLIHVNSMGPQFRLVQLVYTLDGQQVFSQRDDTGALHSKPTLDILSGPISAGTHTVRVVMEYRGHGYGPFQYLTKRTFLARGTQTFTVKKGESVKVEVIGFERKNTALPQRPAVRFKVTPVK